jgi:hypothetical protein
MLFSTMLPPERTFESRMLSDNDTRSDRIFIFGHGSAEVSRNVGPPEAILDEQGIVALRQVFIS